MSYGFWESLVSNPSYPQTIDFHLYSWNAGVGGFGQVFLVQYKDKVSFALKRLKKIEMVKQQQQEHAYSEKEVMLACNSPFIVR